MSCEVSPPSRWRAIGLDAVGAHCAAALAARVARPARAGDDWSIELPRGCRCELCDELGVFLRAASRRRFEWPLAQDRRAHVHRRIEATELPVTHQTRRNGRPYTLVLEKTDRLFQGERQARRRDEADLAWLDRNRSGWQPAGGGGKRSPSSARRRPGSRATSSGA